MGVEEEEGGKGQERGRKTEKKRRRRRRFLPSFRPSVRRLSQDQEGRKGLLRIVRGSGSRGRGKRRRERDFFPLFPFSFFRFSSLSCLVSSLCLSAPSPASLSTDKRGNHLAFCRFLLNPFFSPSPSLSLLATRQLHPSLIYLALAKFCRRISVSSSPLGDYYYYCGEEQKEENSICAVGNFVWGR